VSKCNAPLHGESNLLCCKCGELICPACSVVTPVGIRCRECAQSVKLPTFRLSGRHYLIAVLVGLTLAAVFGFSWRFVMRTMPYPYLNLLIGPGIGSAMSEIISRSVNRKRGLWLAIIAAGSMLICYLIVLIFPGERGFYYYDIIGIGLSVVAAAGVVR
jgi:hypothetical protein